jgi:hypothetical protein
MTSEVIITPLMPADESDSPSTIKNSNKIAASPSNHEAIEMVRSFICAP